MNQIVYIPRCSDHTLTDFLTDQVWAYRQQELDNLASFRTQPPEPVRRRRRPKFTEQQMAIAIASAERTESRNT